jgi:hypothetical protein
MKLCALIRNENDIACSVWSGLIVKMECSVPRTSGSIISCLAAFSVIQIDCVPAQLPYCRLMLGTKRTADDVKSLCAASSGSGQGHC